MGSKSNNPKARNQNQQPGKNKASKTGRKNKSTSNKNDHKNKYAWSAFQASPDASSLPLPVFQDDEEPSGDKNTANLTSTKELRNKEVKPISKQLSTVDESNDVIESKQEEVKASVSPSGTSLPNADLISKLLISIPREEKSNNCDDDSKDDRVIESDGNMKESINSSTNTSSGVDLTGAILDKSKTEENKRYQNYEVSGANNSPYQYPMPNLGHMYGMPPHMHHQQHMISIQVQVPENNGFMMVNTPSGIPMTVQIPPGVHPGMIIPVNVPAPMPGMHMGMQMGGHPYQYPHYNPQQYHIPQNESGPKPGSWAAAASTNGK